MRLRRVRSWAAAAGALMPASAAGALMPLSAAAAPLVAVACRWRRCWWRVRSWWPLRDWWPLQPLAVAAVPVEERLRLQWSMDKSRVLGLRRLASGTCWQWDPYLAQWVQRLLLSQTTGGLGILVWCGALPATGHAARLRILAKNQKREAIADSYSLNRATEVAAMSLTCGDEAPHILYTNSAPVATRIMIQFN